MILSLQGCMAVGKTTAVRYLQEHAPQIRISYENNDDVIAEIRRRSLEKKRFEDYVEIQRLWIRKEIERFHRTKEYGCSVMDFGAEEIEFFTLKYPESVGLNWNPESLLHEELEQLRRCLPDRILFLDASDEVLRRRKENDAARSRNSFEHHLKHLLPLKKEWFLGRENVDILNVDHLSADEAGEKVREWVEMCRNRYGEQKQDGAGGLLRTEA